MKSIDPLEVPEKLRYLIALAMQFGHADDWTRESRVRSATAQELDVLREAIAENNDAFVWLAGPDAKGPTFSDAYIAFSAMRMSGFWREVRFLCCGATW